MNNTALLQDQPPEVMQATQLLTTLLNCFNGHGLITGKTRQHLFEQRVCTAAIRARTLGEFYSRLSRSLQLQQPSNAQSEQLLPLLTDNTNARPVLRVMAEQTQFLVMLAWDMHAEARALRKRNRPTQEENE